MVIEEKTAEGARPVSDHDLSGQLSRAGFALILGKALEEVAVDERSRFADVWCERLMRTAKLRRISWWPSLGSATTGAPVCTSAVQEALEEVLGATPAPHRRAVADDTEDEATG